MISRSFPGELSDDFRISLWVAKWMSYVSFAFYTPIQSSYLLKELVMLGIAPSQYRFSFPSLNLYVMHAKFSGFNLVHLDA